MQQNGLTQPYIRNLNRKFLRKLAHSADGWVFQTEEQREWYGKSIGQATTALIPNAVNEKGDVTPAHIIRTKTIVSAGRLSRAKNHALLIKAFATISDRYPDYRLVIYGDGPLRQQLEALVEDLGMADKVSLPGYTTFVREKMEQASLFVLTSDWEGMPNALIEAMALGVPCISTDCKGGGARFLINDGINGLLTPVGDMEALAASMEKVLCNAVLSQQLSIEAKKYVSAWPERVYAAWETLIQEIIKK